MPNSNAYYMKFSWNGASGTAQFMEKDFRVAIDSLLNVEPIAQVELAGSNGAKIACTKNSTSGLSSLLDLQHSDEDRKPGTPDSCSLVGHITFNRTKLGLGIRLKNSLSNIHSAPNHLVITSSSRESWSRIASFLDEAFLSCISCIDPDYGSMSFTDLSDRVHEYLENKYPPSAPMYEVLGSTCVMYTGYDMFFASRMLSIEGYKGPLAVQQRPDGWRVQTTQYLDSAAHTPTIESLSILSEQLESSNWPRPGVKIHL